MNFIYGVNRFGRNIFASSISSSVANTSRMTTLEFYPGQYSITAYNSDGTKTAVFGSGAEDNALSKVTFEITSTGCGSCELTFRKMPSNTELTYLQRIDIALFGDSKPWYSGYILTCPLEGTTETEFKYTGYGYYQKLENILIFETYEDMDVGLIAREIAVLAEQAGGFVYNETKIETVGYSPTKLVFDGVTAKEALDTLTDFAYDYVYGVDEYRSLYFKRRDTEVNEQARLTVGKHITGYTPEVDVDQIVNWARIKGGNIDDEGEQWLCIVQDEESQETYGLRQEVWDLPSAYEVEDAETWGQNQIEKYKDPVKTAKVTGVKLEYPYPDGTFNVRHMSTDGLAEIRTIDGSTETYPIETIKYTISGDKGIQAEMTLGEPEFTIAQYLFEIERQANDTEQAQNAAIKQLSTS